MLCGSGHEHCTADAHDLFSTFLSNNSHYFHPDTRSLTFKYGVRSGGLDQQLFFDSLWDIYTQEKNVERRQLYMEGLAFASETYLIRT